MHFRIEYSARQMQGARDYQQDSYSVRAWDLEGTDAAQATLLLVLCDGMAGHPQGELASRLASQAWMHFMAHQPRSADLADALAAANRRLADHIADEPGSKGMGTTLLAVRISGDRLHWVSVGDTALLLLRDGHIKRLNADHSMKPVLAKMVEAKQMTAEDAAHDPKRHMLRAAVSGGDIRLTDLGTLDSALQAGDQILLCSDGMETLSINQIRQHLMAGTEQDADTSLNNLLQTIKDAAVPGQDNTTALLVRLLPVQDT